MVRRVARRLADLALRPLGVRADRVPRRIDLGRLLPSPLMEHAAMTLREWSYYHSSSVLGVPHSAEEARGPIRMTYHGVPVRKNPLDLWIYQEIIFELKPDLIIEIGSAQGGSTLWFAHQLDLLGGDRGKVVSLDIDRIPYCVSHPRIVELTGNSSSPEIVRQVQPHRDAASVVLVVHDADHRAERVLDDLRAYGDMVTPGSYFIVEDGLGDLKRAWGRSAYTGGGPLMGILAFLEERTDYQIDYERERYILTQNNLGFLRRSGRP